MGHIIEPSVNDSHAWERNPELRWIYCKPLLYQRLGVKYGLFPDHPWTWPVVLKPAINLYGLSIGARLAHNVDEIAAAPGYVWMPVLQGEHISIDVEMEAGIVMRSMAVKGVAHESFGLFSHWERLDDDYDLVATRVASALCIYGGNFNIEMIGRNVIEVHLRHSDEYGALWEGLRFARPIFHRRRVRNAVRDLEAPHGVCLEDDGYPEYAGCGWYRYAIVYGDDLDELKAMQVLDEAA